MTTPKILQLTFRNENGIRKQSLPIKMMTIFNWTLMGLLLLLQINISDAVKYKGDACMTKSQPGVCKGWSECPAIKTLIDRGEYTNREVVTCGFEVKEELICCPMIKAENNSNELKLTTTSTTTTTTTTPPPPPPERDFWMDLLENINQTSAETLAPDFWQDLLTTTSTTTTTTTTMRPLIVGNQRLNESSEFFDLNALLSTTQKRQTDTGRNSDVAGPNNQRGPQNNQNNGFVNPGHNNRGVNLNSGPINLNQWNFDQSPNNNQRGNNNGRGHSNNGFNGRGQKNNFRGNSGNNGNNGRGNNRGHQNNGRGVINNENGSNRNFFPQNNQNQNQNRGFQYPENNNNPNVFNGPTHQNLNMPPTTTNDQQQALDDLIKNVFDTSSSGNFQNTIEQPKPSEQNLDTLITNVFDLPNTQNTQNNPSNPWIQNVNTHQAQGFPQQNAPLRHVNTFETEPSTNFIQQPVVVQTWPHEPAHTPEFDPIQEVYHNLVNSGMDIVKVEADQVQNSWQQQQQQFGKFVQQPNLNQFGQQQPQINNQLLPSQFGQQPFQNNQLMTSQFGPQQVQTNHLTTSQFGPQPVQTNQLLPTQFGPQPVQTNQLLPIQFGQQPVQSNQLMTSQFGQQPIQFAGQTSKGIRSAQQQFIGNSPNIQSPPLNILDPFKPFEFRPSPEDELNNSLSPTQKPTVTSNTERPAVRACRRIEKGLNASLTIHILGGTPVGLGELPHMVGIGYSRVGGEDRPPYDIRCGGTLIDTRFVLTAAHCVSNRESVPSIVRLGVVNNTDGAHMRDAVEVRIKETFIHDDYSTSSTYNDIAILELERAVVPNDIVFPVCLHSDIADPDTSKKLWVSGWGTYNITTRSFSNILLKAPLYTAPLESCNQSYVEYGLDRKIKEGIRRTQICAVYEGAVKDTCQGDSGGPLQLVVDESLKQYRLVGVVSAGFSCGTPTPSLYTRVAAFLDFIERIVWPNGGD